MKTDIRFFQERGILLPLMILFSACTSSTSYLSVDMKDMRENRVKASKIYSEVELVPLSLSEGVHPKDDPRLAVADDGVFFLSDAGEILCYGMDGAYRSTISTPEGISAFSLFEDMYIDVLSGRAIHEYGQSDYSHHWSYQIPDTSAVCVDIMRRGEVFWNWTTSSGEVLRTFREGQTIFLAEYRDNINGMCEYYLERGAFYTIDTSLCPPSAERPIVARNSRFFRSEDRVYYLYSDTGQIWEYKVLLHPEYTWNFGEAEFSTDAFRNAQLMSDKVFLAFRHEDADCLLVYDTGKGKYLLTGALKGGSRFPLGTIYKGYNYYICPAAEVEKLVDGKFLAGENREIVQRAKDASCHVLIKYRLVS